MMSYVAVKMASCFLAIISHLSSSFVSLCVSHFGLELDPIEDTGMQ